MKKNILKCLGLFMCLVVIGGCSQSTDVPDADTAVEANDTEEDSVDDDKEDAEDNDNDTDTDADKDEDVAIGDELPDLRDILIAEAGCPDSEIAAFIRDDLDGDGHEEAFALIGEMLDGVAGEIVVEGELWFVSEYSCKMLLESVGLGIRNEPHYMTLGDVSYIMFDDVFVSEMYTFVYYVSYSEVYEFELSGVGSIWPDESEKDRFTVSNSSYDAIYDSAMEFMVGHTWKNYYFYYDSEDGQIYEYGGTSIDAATAEMWSGKDLVGTLVPEGDAIDSVFMRGNGLIVINYEHEDEDGSIEYYHYIYDTVRECLINDYGREDDEVQTGTYLYALLPERASYPEVPGPDGMVWYGF